VEHPKTVCSFGLIFPLALCFMTPACLASMHLASASSGACNGGTGAGSMGAGVLGAVALT
jgi:hypothetical protein